MQLSSVINFILLSVTLLLLPESFTGFRISQLPKIFDYNYYLNHYQKANVGATDNSSRNKIFLGRSLGIFKHNILFVHNKSNYYLHQGALMDLTPEELRKRLAQSSNSDLKPVLEAEDFGDVPANHLNSIRKLNDDTIQDELDEKHDLITDEMIDFNYFADSQDVMESLGQAKNSNSMQDETIITGEGNIDMPKLLDFDLQEDYMTPKTSDRLAVKIRGQSVNVNTPEIRRTGNELSYKTAPGDTLHEIMSSFSDSVDNMLDDWFVMSSSQGGEKNKEGTTNVTDVMNPKIRTNSIRYKIDWRITGCIGRPKAQDACNACYIFATLDLLEYFYCRQTKAKKNFSSQYILDCGRNLGFINGCQGGRMTEVGRFVRNYGLKLASDYPYTGKHSKCKSLGMNGEGIVKTEIVNWQLFDSITAWYKWARKSPLLVGINMPTDFHIYGGGIHDGKNCNISETHAMLLVGSGMQDGIDFWLLKNSFSEDWGEKGYFRLSKSALLNCFGSAIVARATFS